MRTRLPLVEEMDGPPVVGRKYLVRCAWWPWAKAWMPVIGDVHEDADLNTPVPHLHYDLRFIPERLLGGNDAAVYMTKVQHVDRGEVLSYQRRRCLREQPTFPFLGSPTQVQFEARHEGRVARDCRRCPHRGLDLAAVPIDAEGGKVCPGHGLRWHHKTGALMRRRPPVRGPVRAPALQVAPFFLDRPSRVPIIGDNPRCVDIAAAARREGRAP